jgi:hypothetical protein
MRELRTYGSVRGRGSIHDGRDPAYLTDLFIIDDLNAFAEAFNFI